MSYCKADDGQDDVLTSIEIVEALEVLEYHDRNYLSKPLANPCECAREKLRLLGDAKRILRARHL